MGRTTRKLTMGAKKDRKKKAIAAKSRKRGRDLLGFKGKITENNLANMLGVLNMKNMRKVTVKVPKSKTKPQIGPVRASARQRGVRVNGVGLVFAPKKRATPLPAIAEGSATASGFGGPVVPIHSARNMAPVIHNPVAHSSSNKNYKNAMNNDAMNNFTRRIGTVKL